LILPKVIPSKVKNMFLNTAILKISLHEVTKNFLSMLIKNNRIYVIEYIMREFENIVRDYKNELEIEVTTAVEIEEKKKEKLIDQLQEIFNKKIQLNIVVDKDVLGGLSVKVKSQLLDATLKNKLQRIKILVLQN
jgi:F-type H+-transporting ATPase subunit delta